jgi:hypothetical protein
VWAGSPYPSRPSSRGRWSIIPKTYQDLTGPRHMSTSPKRRAAIRSDAKTLFQIQREYRYTELVRDSGGFGRASNVMRGRGNTPLAGGAGQEPVCVASPPLQPTTGDAIGWSSAFDAGSLMAEKARFRFGEARRIVCAVLLYNVVIAAILKRRLPLTSHKEHFRTSVPPYTF